MVGGGKKGGGKEDETAGGKKKRKEIELNYVIVCSVRVDWGQLDHHCASAVFVGLGILFVDPLALPVM